MKKRKIICAVCLSAALSVAGTSAACAAETAGGEIQIVTAESAGKTAQKNAGADGASSGSDSAQEALPAAEEDGVIMEEPGETPQENTQPDESTPSGEETQENGSLDLVIEALTVVEDPGMVDSQKIEEGVEALAQEQEQEEPQVPRLFRSDIPYDIPEVMRTAYSWLRTDLGFNHAAACGVLANIQYESGFNPGAIGDGGTSYGLCQWRKGRCRSLIDYCVSQDMAFASVEGQLAYLSCEMSGEFQNVRSYLSRVPDTAQGAYNAAAYWCRYFEMPSRTAEKEAERGEFAANVLFWKEFSSLTQDDLNEMGTAEAENKLLMPEGQMDELQVAYTAVLSSAIEERGAQLIQNVKECYSAVDHVVQTGKEIYSYLEDTFYIPEETIEAGIKDLIAGGYSRYEQMRSGQPQETEGDSEIGRDGSEKQVYDE